MRHGRLRLTLHRPFSTAGVSAGEMVEAGRIKGHSLDDTASHRERIAVLLAREQYV